MRAVIPMNLQVLPLALYLISIKPVLLARVISWDEWFFVYERNLETWVLGPLGSSTLVHKAADGVSNNECLPVPGTSSSHLPW